MHNKKFKTMAAAAAVIMSILLTSCSSQSQQTDKPRTSGEISQTSSGIAVEPTTSEPTTSAPTTSKPLDLDEDLSKYDLK